MTVRFTQAFLAIFLVSLVACNNNKGKDEANNDSTSAGTENAEANKPATPANQPKSFKAVFTPDTVILGKSSEALIKILSASGVALSDPDGTDTGTEFVVKLQVTNKSLINQGNSVSVSYSDSRLQLDNGTSITAETGTDYLRAEPESTSKAESWTYRIPAGAKPTALNLFMNNTRASASIVLE